MDALAVDPRYLTVVDRFHEIPDGAAILCFKSGIYRQAKLFRRGRELYAGMGIGFIRLMTKGNTSSPNIRYHGIDPAGSRVTEDPVGKLLVEVMDA